jgi:hypothetical protein
MRGPAASRFAAERARDRANPLFRLAFPHLWQLPLTCDKARLPQVSGGCHIRAEPCRIRRLRRPGAHTGPASHCRAVAHRCDRRAPPPRPTSQPPVPAPTSPATRPDALPSAGWRRPPAARSAPSLSQSAGCPDSAPRSRTNPRFNADALPAALAAHRIGHRRLRWLGGLRGRRKDQGPSRNAFRENAGFRNHAHHTATPEFRERMAEPRDLGRAHTRAVLCAEATWWRCHRRTPARFAD